MRLPLLLLLALAVTGCTNVTFPEPMPLKRNDLTAFPSRWQGTWKDDKGETFIITPNTLTSTGDGEICHWQSFIKDRDGRTACFRHVVM